MRKAVQQIMLGTVTGSEAAARTTLQRIKAAGYDGLELNRFMIHPSSLMIRMMTRAAGMPTGKGGNLDWKKLMREADLSVISLHTDLGSLEREADAIAQEAKDFGTDTVVITGMYRFDYGDEKAVRDLAARLNKAGEVLKKMGLFLLYHNHNVELLQVKPGLRAYDLLLSETDPGCVSFEFDTWKPHEAVAYHRPGLPAKRPLHDPHPQAGQHGAWHRQYGSGRSSCYRLAEWCPRRCAGKSQKLDRQGSGKKSGAQRKMAEGEVLKC